MRCASRRIDTRGCPAADVPKARILVFAGCVGSRVSVMVAAAETVTWRGAS
jgi:hypothetical protein